MNFTQESRIRFSRESVMRWHHRPGAFLRLAPPFDRIHAPLLAPGIHQGSISAFQLGVGPFRLTWKSIHEVDSNGDFTDEMISGPFARWKHHHQFIEQGSETLLKDSIEWEGPFFSALTPFSKGEIHRTLKKNFTVRQRRLEHDLTRHERFIDRPRLKIGITGATGVIGSSLSPFLSTGGHEVYHFVRRKPAHEREIYWNPLTQEIEIEKVRTLDAVIHLAGENVAGKRWNPSFKALVKDSRVQGTGLIARTLAQLNDRPRRLISASAIGIYSGGFLGEVCEAWEKALDPVRESQQVHLSIARIGVVLTSKGGALRELTLPALLGLGGKIGSGEQPISWISLDDVIGALYELLFREGESGLIVDLVSPKPIEQQVLSRTLSKVLKRPHFLTLPTALIRLVFGQMGEEVLLGGQSVIPVALQRMGFRFEFSDLEDLIRFETGRFIKSK